MGLGFLRAGFFEKRGFAYNLAAGFALTNFSTTDSFGAIGWADMFPDKYDFIFLALLLFPMIVCLRVVYESVHFNYYML